MREERSPESVERRDKFAMAALAGLTPAFVETVRRGGDIDKELAAAAATAVALADETIKQLDS